MKKKKTKKKNTNILGFDTIEVLGHTLTIVETDDTNELLVNNQLCFGAYLPVDSRIVISTRQSLENMKQTFYHELLHAIDFLSHNEDYKYDEETVNVLGRGLATVRLE